MEKIFIIGSGTMGSGIAQIFAAGGYEVVINSRDIQGDALDRGYKKIRKNLLRLVEKGKLSQDKMEDILSRISCTNDINLAADSDLVIEAVIEDIKEKKKIFSQLDNICKPNTILASNTSSLSITEIASVTNRPDKVIGMHFFNPVQVMKLIEIIRGIATSQDTFDLVKEVSITLGKEPVDVKEAPGFLVNRLLIPMINEAVGVLADGIASAEDIDRAMMLGANHPMGPLALSDLIGNDIVLAIMEVMFKETGDQKYRPHTLLKQYVKAGYLGKKSSKGFFEYSTLKTTNLEAAVTKLS